MKIKKIIVCLLTACSAMCGIAKAADAGILIKDGDFENGIDGFGITYSGRNDTTLPYIFESSDITSSGNGSLQFVASSTLTEKTSTSGQSLGFAYQGIYNADYISVESGLSYTVSADFYTECSGVKMRFIEMDGNKAVAMSPEITLEEGIWQTEVYKWDSDISTDKNRVRTVFYNIQENDSVYIDNFAYRADYISDSSWKADTNGRIDNGERGISYTASSSSFEKYCGIYASIDKDAFEANKEYVLSGYVDSDMADAALCVSVDNIDNCFSEYIITPGNRAYVSLCFNPSMCPDDEISFSLTATGTAGGSEGKINFSGIQINEADTFVKAVQKNGKLLISGKLRSGNENKELNVSVTGMSDQKTLSDENGEYSFECDLPEVQTSREVFVSISNVGGYEDLGGVINGYTVIYNEDYRNDIAKEADEKTSLEALKGVLTDEALQSTGISKIKDFRLADKDFVFGYLLDVDFSSYEELEDAVKAGSVLSGLSNRKISLTDSVSKYEAELMLGFVPAYKNEYEKADKAAVESLFKQCTTKIDGLEDLHYVLTEVLIKEKAAKAVNNSEIMSYIEKYADDLSLDLSKYKALNPTQIRYEVTNSFASYLKNADSFKTLQSKLDELISNAGNGRDQGGSKGGSTGGGSSGKNAYEKVNAAPAPNETADEKPEFNDLSNFSWAKDGIYALLERGIISKSADGRFRPSDNVTRAEFAKMISIAFDFKAAGSEPVFDDVNKTDWYFEYVTAMYENKIVNGISDNYFGAYEPITRQDICTILGRIMGINDNADINDAAFIDMASASDYAKGAIAEMSSKGYVNGYDDGSFRPHNNATRAEAAKLIYSITEQK
ncbi:MAG: S-layer homology domain-containing protein [Clostridia bacterium]|nr:S-layer homology domain-containing protein [Clostridia bacterium]